jgi:hypothetical protein
VESQLPEWTRVEVDTTKEGWGNEFKGLEKYVKVDAEGKTTLSFADTVLLDIDGNPIKLETTDFSYNPEGTVIKFAQEDRIWVGAWEFTKDENGEYKLKDVVRIRAPRPDTKGVVEDPATVVPHLNKEDMKLMDLFIAQTANIDIFEDGTFPVSKAGLTPDHFTFKQVPSKYGFPEYEYFYPAPPRSETSRFQDMKPRSYPVWVQTDSPSIFINELGTLITTSILDRSTKTYNVKSIIQIEGYIKSSEHLNSPTWFGTYLINKDLQDKSYVEALFLQNNANLVDFIETTGVPFNSFAGAEEILAETFFTTGYPK